MTTAAAAVLLAGVTIYAVFGGADFGAGIWDLLAGRSLTARQARERIDHSIAPVWEANHVWLIFIFVVLWTAFPTAYASITLTLFVPLTLAAFGIVLRGASFAFRKVVVLDWARRDLGEIFAAGSLLVPFAFGTIAGAIASGEVPAGGEAGDPVDSWLNPTSLVCGALALVAVLYLSAVYITFDSRREEDHEMVHYFRRRAVGAGIATGLVAAVGLVVLHDEATYVYHGLTSRALPLVLAAVICGVTSLVLMHRDAHHWARALAIASIGAIVVAWGVAQWPYILPTSTKIADAAAPTGTLGAVLLAAVLAVLIVVPAITLLYWLDQKDLLPEEGIEETPAADHGP